MFNSRIKFALLTAAVFLTVRYSCTITDDCLVISIAVEMNFLSYYDLITGPLFWFIVHPCAGSWTHFRCHMVNDSSWYHWYFCSIECKWSHVISSLGHKIMMLDRMLWTDSFSHHSLLLLLFSIKWKLTWGSHSALISFCAKQKKIIQVSEWWLVWIQNYF